jgi:hypothetical protein
MKTNVDRLNHDLCIALMESNSEKEIIKLLTDTGYWNNKTAWRYYGDRASNFNDSTAKRSACNFLLMKVGRRCRK